MKVNTLDYATEGVLSMEYEDGQQRLIVYLSKSLNMTKKNYKIYNKETGKLETLIKEHQVQILDLDRL